MSPPPTPPHAILSVVPRTILPTNAISATHSELRGAFREALGVLGAAAEAAEAAKVRGAGGAAAAAADGFGEAVSLTESVRESWSAPPAAAAAAAALSSPLLPPLDAPPGQCCGLAT